MKKSWLLTGTAIIAIGGVAYGQVSFPLYTALTGAEIIQDEGNPTSGFFKSSLLANYVGTLAGSAQGSALIGGDASSNLFQRGTSVAGITNVTFGPDRWFAWSGASTGLTVAQDTTAGDFPQTATSGISVTRTGSGVVQSCVGQDVVTPNAVRFAGQTAEFDFHAIAGSGFSAASSNLQAYVVYGTGTSEGASAMAYTINTGGGAGAGWTNGAIAASPLVKISTTLERVTVAAAIPATVSASAVTEVGVALCWTPIGGSPSNDSFTFSLAQLLVNPTLTPSSSVATINSSNAKAFIRRLASDEAREQLTYYWEQDEGANSQALYAPCRATGATAATCVFQFPTRMFAVPTLSYTAGTIVATLGTSNASQAVSAASIATGGATNYNANVTLTSTSLSSGVNGFLQAGNSTGGGKIKFSAEP